MRRLDYTLGAAGNLILHLHRDRFDRGMVATFGDSFRLEQPLTASVRAVRAALWRIHCQAGDESTRLYDSIEDAITELWHYGLRTRPWLLVVITAGRDNRSSKYRRNPRAIGRYIARRFNDEPSNYLFLIAVGESQRIDRRTLARVSDDGDFPAIAVGTFSLLETVLLEMALDISARLAGERIDCCRLSWDEVARMREHTQAPLDYALLIDRSGSMAEEG